MLVCMRDRPSHFHRTRREGAVSGAITAKRVVTHPYFSMTCFICILFLLPQYGGIAVMVGSASILSVYVAVVPERFRSRSGSVFTAICLVVSMWIAAAAITAMTLSGHML